MAEREDLKELQRVKHLRIQVAARAAPSLTLCPAARGVLSPLSLVEKADPSPALALLAVAKVDRRGRVALRALLKNHIQRKCPRNVKM